MVGLDECAAASMMHRIRKGRLCHVRSSSFAVLSCSCNAQHIVRDFAKKTGSWRSVVCVCVCREAGHHVALQNYKRAGTRRQVKSVWGVFNFLLQNDPYLSVVSYAEMAVQYCTSCSSCRPYKKLLHLWTVTKLITPLFWKTMLTS